MPLSREIGPLLGGASGGGGIPTGVASLKVHSFAYNTPGLTNGLAFYTPTIGEILLDAWIEVDTPWDGTTPLGDMGQYVSDTGWYQTLGNEFTQDMTLASSTAALAPGEPLLQSTNTPSLSFMSSLNSTWLNPQLMLNAIPPTTQTLSPTGFEGIQYNLFIVPAAFTSTAPVQVTVNQAGVALLPGQSTTAGVAVPVPLTVTTGTNDQFGFGPTGSPLTYTVAGGTYTTVAAVAAAMNAALSGGTPFGNIATAYAQPLYPTGTYPDTQITVNFNTKGSVGLGYSFVAGTNNFLTAPSLTHLIGAMTGSFTPVSSGSTRGAGKAYLYTVIPEAV